MDAVTSYLMVFQISVFILPLDHANGQPLYENPQEDSLKDSEGHSYCRKFYGKKCLLVIITSYSFWQWTELPLHILNG